MQQRALGFLFTLLTLALVGVAIAAILGAHGVRRWVIAAAALAIAAWLGSAAASGLRR